MIEHPNSKFMDGTHISQQQGYVGPPDFCALGVNGHAEHGIGGVEHGL
jgi:hypothetical protein